MGSKVLLILCHQLGPLTNSRVTSFYRDDHGEAYLKNHGFMIEWAKQAGKLVFADAEDLHDDNIVTFSILALFWYSQGSWRLCYLHKGKTCRYFAH